jgi:hypothetical protein
VFNTVQVPPKLQAKYQEDAPTERIPFKTDYHPSEILNVKEPFRQRRKKVTSQKSPPNTVDVPFLNKLYKIPNNKGNPLLSQAVIETADEYFSPGDLLTFQKAFNLTRQAAIVYKGYNTTDCLYVAGNCFEGNLDIQYMMGIAQKTVSLYWYSSYLLSDPFLAWITDVSNLRNPPQSNSISWSIDEVVREFSLSLSLSLSLSPFLSLLSLSLSPFSLSPLSASSLSPSLSLSSLSCALSHHRMYMLIGDVSLSGC